MINIAKCDRQNKPNEDDKAHLVENSLYNILYAQEQFQLSALEIVMH